MLPVPKADSSSHSFHYFLGIGQSQASAVRFVVWNGVKSRGISSSGIPGRYPPALPESIFRRGPRKPEESLFSHRLEGILDPVQEHPV